MEPTTRGEQAATPAWRWIWLAWLFPAVISTLQQVALYASRGALAREWPYAALQFPRMMAWALVTPLIFAAHRRWPLQRPGLARHIAIHAGLSTAISVVMESVWLPLTVAISARLNPGVPEPVGIALYLIAFLGRLVPGALTYAAVLGVASTLQSREALRRRDVASEQLRGAAHGGAAACAQDAAATTFPLQHAACHHGPHRAGSGGRHAHGRPAG